MTFGFDSQLVAQVRDLGYPVETAEQCVAAVQRAYEVDAEEARRMLENVSPEDRVTDA